ncbi:ribosomal protein L7/L12 [Solirubrobacter phytolaccae]|uniref:Ribosomal protein L7/L12 n=1 Tax=Solirubrobacter phytolaccae TaxID=1404360 RepID=A0A9X3S9R6_9ACTN|nr:ribosomal protein L7/L12 [Solirubrobacter phytolaccae]MDA0181776.1 ribosomal protein L7/L12 [Solirubrobacter phytolaccae]
MPPVLTIVDVGPRPADVIAAIDVVTDVGPRRAAELVEWLPAFVGRGLHAALAEVLREELQRAGAIVELREPPPPAPVVPSAAPTGESTVKLVDAGEDRLRVIKRVCTATGLTLREAKELVDAAPTVVASGLSTERAAALRHELESAGARVEAA